MVVDPSALAIADAVALLLDDPRREAAMRTAAAAGAARHDWDVIVDQMEQAYLCRCARTDRRGGRMISLASSTATAQAIRQRLASGRFAPRRLPTIAAW